MRPPLALAAGPLLRAVVLFITTGFLTCGISAQLTGAQDSDRFPIIRSDKLGFIDGSGREVIAPQFGNAADAARFREGMANVGGAGGWGYVDASGKFVIEPKFWWAYPFSEGFACVELPEEGAGYGFIDKTGRLLIQGLKADSVFHDGLAAIPVDGKWGYVGTDMKLRIPAQFQFAAAFSESLGGIELTHKWGYIDKTGTVVVRPKYDITMPFHNGLGRVKVFVGRKAMPSGIVGMEGQNTENVYLWGFVDPEGREAISPQFLDATDFSEGNAFAKPNDGTNLFGIIDKSGSFIHRGTFDEATEYSESVAAVRLGEKWGYVDHAGSWAIPPKFARAEPFWHGLARVAFSAGRWGYIDKNGSVVWENKSQ